MNKAVPLLRDRDLEVAALIKVLHDSGKRLEELTGGEVDTVADHEGRMFLLQRSQEYLRMNEATKQAAILNALPAHTALLDPQGVILSVNDTWLDFGCTEVIEAPGHAIGANYVDLCAAAQGEGAPAAHRAAEGIRSVLDGSAATFSIEYPCDTPTEKRWFLLTVTPLARGLAGGAVVMHINVTAERLSSEKLQASELRFRQMADSSRDVFFLLSASMSEICYVSPAYEQIWGRTCESLYTDPASWLSSIHPDDVERMTGINKNCDGGFDGDFRIVRPDGQMRWVHVRAFPILNELGERYRTGGVASDITNRKAAADELRESQRRFSDLLGNVEMVSVMLDMRASVTYCNDYLLRLTGWKREEVIGRNWFDLFIPVDDNGIKTAFDTLLAELPVASHHENEILTRSGERRLIQWNTTVLRSATGDVAGTASIGDDITERRQVEARLRLKNEALNAAANSMIITDRDRTIVWVNPAFTALTGYTEADAIGRNPQLLLESGTHDAAFHQNIWTSIAAGTPWSGEMTSRRKDGSLYTEASTITPVRDHDGTISHFICINTDLTTQHQMEEQLRQAQKMEAVGHLAAGVAHEFNNLLQALMSMATIVRMHAILPLVAKVAGEMETQIKRGAALTQQLLLFSRRQAIERSSLDVREEMQKARELLQRLLSENITIVVEGPVERLAIDGDSSQMQQVLLNLAINARDAMPGGGTLTLRAGRAGDHAWIEIEDTGEGFDEVTRTRLFEPFFTTKERGKGTGLGLAVVHGIIAEHGGRIDAESERGVGSVFRITLPLVTCKRPQVEAVGDGTGESAAVASGHILLVEDEEGVREGIAVLLGIIGYDITAVASGEEALALALDPPPDVLLSDVTLPGIAGLQLGERLSERWPSLSVVLMSGYIEEAIRSGVMERGWLFLQKPFELKDLTHQIRSALRNARPNEVAETSTRSVSDVAALR